MTTAAAAAAAANPTLAALEEFLKSYPHINYATSTSPDYASLRAIFYLDNSAVPLAIVRPKSAQDVAVLVSYAISHDIEFTVRGGGNSLYGLSQVQDALTIDLRDIDYVHVDEASSSARIGGGIVASALGTELSKYGLATAFGTVGFIGWTGWAIYGGYGPFSAKYGLGVDQILGAKVVNANGELVVANPEMLKAIRGAGGALGVITELTIKVYPLKKVLNGTIIFDPSNISEAIKQFYIAREELLASEEPEELSLQPAVINSPQGKGFGVMFTWASDDHEKGRLYLEKVLTTGKVIMNTVQPLTVGELLNQPVFISSAHGSVDALSIRRITKEASEIIARYAEKMPSNLATATTIHHYRHSAAKIQSESIFRSREPHYMIEFIWTATDVREVVAAKEWADAFRAELTNVDPSNVLPTTYISLTPPGAAPLSALYGPQHQTLLNLQEKYDSKGVFSKSVPRLFS